MDKAPDAYRMISEVAEALDIPAHVLRFWETKFPQIKPLKRGGGRRYYRRGDVDLLRAIRHLLYEDAYTIRGVQRLLKTQGVQAVLALRAEGATLPAVPEDAPSGEDLEALTTAQLIEELSTEIEACRRRLAGLALSKAGETLLASPAA